MAKKNKVILMGYIEEFLNKEKTTFKIRIRKNENKFIYPIIQLSNSCLGAAEKLEIDYAVAVEGKIRTEHIYKEYNCPNDLCNDKIIYKHLFTTISAKTCHVLEKNNDNLYMNQVILLGPVCREKIFKYIEGTKSPLGHAKYQIAVGRKVPKETDYPWIATYARQAEEDNVRLIVGSQVLVDGSVVTRNKLKKCKCNNCESSIEINEFFTEIQGNTVEYLNNCNFA